MLDPIVWLHVKIMLTQIHVARDEEGQGLTDYALILALIAVLAIAALKFLSGRIDSALNTIASSL